MSPRRQTQKANKSGYNREVLFRRPTQKASKSGHNREVSLRRPTQKASKSGHNSWVSLTRTTPTNQGKEVFKDRWSLKKGSFTRETQRKMFFFFKSGLKKRVKKEGDLLTGTSTDPHNIALATVFSPHPHPPNPATMTPPPSQPYHSQ